MRKFIYYAVLIAVVVVGTSFSVGRAEEENEEQHFVYNDHGNRDPFWPLVNQNGSIINFETDFTIADLYLEGVMAGTGGKNLAIINGKIVRENDKIGQFSIIHIESESVTLRKGEDEFTLKLKKED